MRRSRVVLPQPEGPSSVKNSLAFIATETPSSARTAPPAKLLTSPRQSTATSAAAPRAARAASRPARRWRLGGPARLGGARPHRSRQFHRHVRRSSPAASTAILVVIGSNMEYFIQSNEYLHSASSGFFAS